MSNLRNRLEIKNEFELPSKSKEKSILWVVGWSIVGAILLSHLILIMCTDLIQNTYSNL